MLGLRTSSHRDGLTDPASSTSRTRATTRSRSCSPIRRRDAVEEITGIPRRDLERAAHIYAEADERLDRLGPRRHRAQVRLRGRAADLQPRDDDRQPRPAGRGAAAAARPEQRAGLLRHGRAPRHVHRLPLGRRRGRRPLVRGGVGRHAVRGRRATRSREMFDAAVAGDLKAMYIFGEDVAQTDPEHGARDQGARERSSSSSARTSSRPRRRSTPTSSCPPPRSSRRPARSPTPSAGSSSSRPRSTRPEARRPDLDILQRSSAALGHEIG